MLLGIKLRAKARKEEAELPDPNRLVLSWFAPVLEPSPDRSRTPSAPFPDDFGQNRTKNTLKTRKHPQKLPKHPQIRPQVHQNTLTSAQKPSNPPQIRPKPHQIPPKHPRNPPKSAKITSNQTPRPFAPMWPARFPGICKDLCAYAQNPLEIRPPRPLVDMWPARFSAIFGHLRTYA